jgi:hypothetical protein
MERTKRVTIVDTKTKTYEEEVLSSPWFGFVVVVSEAVE